MIFSLVEPFIVYIKVQKYFVFVYLIIFIWRINVDFQWTKLISDSVLNRNYFFIMSKKYDFYIWKPVIDRNNIIIIVKFW